ncbi:MULTISPECIES: gamma-glutamyltransferase family protein [Ramlibacter]|uniref:gamma-glutamyltransferase family protein n=1 Tax=Ramlibacter TaxID=174951 RepID=UPI00308429C8
MTPGTRRLAARWGAALLAALLAGCAAPPEPVQAQPEAASGWTPKSTWTGARFAVAAANPLATEAGVRILRAGGSAIDAAVAVQMVLALVEPQSSGIGGGAFLLYHDGRTTEAFDGRETAPAAATDDLFLRADGQPMALREAMVGGRAVGVPGAVAMLQQVHRRHGRLPWRTLFEPAIRLADEGFAVSPRLHALLAEDADLVRDPVAARYFYDDAGRPWPAGHRLRNPELAAVLRAIAEGGADALAQGEVAQAIVGAVRGHARNPGRLAARDLAAYRPVERPPLCFDHLVYRVCGMPPPSSGQVAIGQILGLLQAAGADREPAGDGPSGRWLHLYTEASRLAFADRAQYVADPAFVPPPAGGWGSLLAPRYLAERAHLIGEIRQPTVAPGRTDNRPVAHAPMADQVEEGTSHVSVIDGAGHALALTTSIEAAWGSHVMVNRGHGLAGGFLLNNQLTDFSFLPRDAQGRPVANRVEPGKRPRSSMAPTLVFDRATGQPVLVAGSPGGTMIIHYVARTLWGLWHWHLGLQQAVDGPNFGVAGSDAPLLVEPGRIPDTALAGVGARGHRIQASALTSGLQLLARTPDGRITGAADPRREGVVAGE